MSTNENKHWHIITPATWPPPPAEMSVSTYVEIEACPRRWALSTAEYPELWSGRGYPPKLQVATLAGSVVHLALEKITKQFMRAGVPSLSDPSAPQVLRELGGYTRVVDDCLERILKRYVDNPRAGAMLEQAYRTLRGQVPTLRARVQSMLSRLHLTKRNPSELMALTSMSSGLPSRLPLLNGIYPEVVIRAKSIGWKGKIDLLFISDEACVITEFKTGKVDEVHKFQIRAYAVMWQFDYELNPSGRSVDRLVLAYENQDVHVATPSASEIEKLGRELLTRRQSAEAELNAHPPVAYPKTETCQYCGVRQLCDEYWTSEALVCTNDGRFGDIELKITGRHGPTSWDAEVVRARDLPANTPALLRLQQHRDIKEGTLVRVLDAALARDPEDDASPAIISLGLFSEAFYEPH